MSKKKSGLYAVYKPGDMFSDVREDGIWVILEVRPWERRGKGRLTYYLMNVNTGKKTHMHDVVVNARLNPLVLTLKG
jgi:hypothetical protein